MKRIARSLAVVGVAALALTGCSGLGSQSSGSDQAAFDPNKKVTVTVWSGFTDRELKVFQSVLDKYHEKHPNVTIENVGSQTDDKITQAIRGGNAPDVALSFSANNIGTFCGSGVFQDLGPMITRDDVDLNKIPKATLAYTQYQGKRCAMPLLADVFGLYYNKKMFAEAGITAPPKTISEFTEDAKKLTKKAADGSIEVAGFVPTPGFYANKVEILAPQWGAQWLNKDDKSQLATDENWSAMLNWQKSLTDFYGNDALTRFTSEAGQQYSADHIFQTGKLAMMLDGEYRTAFIADQAPDLDYATAPFPVADEHPELYGTGYTTGNIVGIPKGAKNTAAAWDLIKFLSTDKDALVLFANGLGNVPTSTDALDSPDLKLPAQFKTFLDMYGEGKLQTNPSTANGGAYRKVAQDFATAYVAGSQTDLAKGLAGVDKQIDDSAALGAK
ncbi:MAG: ABC transporter substrate-binding protein [Actinobacteria bacterium]|nr:ABC transporter substrate-binding protein [Actinomycetota bacterium]